MVLLAIIWREGIHAAVRIARHGYYFVPGERGQWRAAEFGGSPAWPLLPRICAEARSSLL
jgi:hypothetical protein